jgi:predicted aldo/keto reductase-like oxidoreductase
MKEDRTASRREFIKAGTSGIAATAFLAACSPRSQEKPLDRAKFTHRTLGKTGIVLPVVSMGSAYAIDLVRAALDAGIVYIHTSSSYSEMNQERRLGFALRGIPRDSFVIGTSPDLPYRFQQGSDRSGDVGTDIDSRHILKSLEGSLQRLGLDHVDIYYLVSVGRRECVLHEPYMRAFAALKQAGKTRFAGIGTHSNEPEIIRAAAESRFWDVILTAYNFRQSYREEVRAAIRGAAAAGLGVVAMKTQAGVYWDRFRSRRINMKAALKWVLSDENVHTTIPAFSNYDEMLEDLSVMQDLTLTPAERQDLNLGQALGLSGMYCQQCGQCRGQCPVGMDIPALMRGYMYAAGHQRPAKARETLAGWTAADIACVGCARCDVRCLLGHDIRFRAQEMARLLHQTT